MILTKKRKLASPLARIFLWLTSFLLAWSLLGTARGYCQENNFQVESITLDSNGDLAIEFPANEGSYYLLKRGSTVDLQDEGVDGQIGADGTGVLRDVNVGGVTRAFYVVQKISVDDPLDMDEDGMDDVFELQYPAFLNPFDASDAEVDFDQDGASNLKEYQDGTDPSQPPLASAKIVSVTPADGEAMVNVTRNAVVRFDRPINPDTVDESSFYLQLNQAPVAGQVEVSSTGMFATFFPDQTLPASTQLQVVVDGNLVKDLDGIPLDGDDDGMAGGISRTRFRTLPLTRIDGTNVWGYVKDSLTGEPIAGVTIYVNAFPQASGVTDDEGRFELMNMPAPEFFVHIVGATAIDTPAGYQYPSMGKPIESVPGQTTQVSKGGEPFDIFLPLMALDDVQELSASEVTEVGFGSGGKQTLTGLFPEADPTVWDRVCVDIAPGSARDDKGTIRNEAALIPVPPDRIPEPLPEELPMPLVISVQVFNATRFDVPAPVTFPNLPDPVTGEVLPPGAKSGLWSYDHDAGRWILQGSMTVSEDGLYLVSDPGVGIRAPGWHGANTGNSGEGGGGDDKDEECEKAKEKMLNSVAQCTAGNFFELLELAPGLGCAVSLASSAIGASVECDIEPEKCGNNIAKAAISGVLGCIPGAGFLLGNVFCVESLADSLGDLKACEKNGTSSQPLLQSYSGQDIPAGTPYQELLEDQITLMQHAQDLYLAAVGDPVWASVPFKELTLLQDWMQSFVAAMETDSPGGATISNEEVGNLLSLTRPSTITEQDVNTLIVRFNRFISGGVTDNERDSMLASANALLDTAEMLEALGWETSSDGYLLGMEALTTEIDAAVGQVKPAALYYRVTALETGFTRRGRLNADGKFSNLILMADTYYAIDYLDPQTFKLGSALFYSPEAGNTVQLPKARLVDSIESDSDGDGLPDDAEAVLGTFPDNPDSDGDGIPDGEELLQGQNPLNGISLPVGTLAVVPISDLTRGIDVVGNRAYVSTDDTGLAIIDISDPLLPILESEISLPGENVDIKVSPSSLVAAVSTSRDDGFLNFVDVSDPEQPVLLKSLDVTPGTILEREGVFYISAGWPNDDRIHLYEATTQEHIGIIQAGGTISGMELYKHKLLLAAGNDLEIYDITEAGFPLISDSPLPGKIPAGNGWQLHAENQVLYVGTSTGYATMDISDPSSPQLIKEPDGSRPAVQRMVSNGAGLLAAISGAGLTFGIDIFNTDDPAEVDDLLVTEFTLGRPKDMVLKNGLLYVADHFNGVSVFNILDLDRNGIPPVVSLNLEDMDIEPGTEGIQVKEGSRIFVETDAIDDVHTRESGWILNDQVMASSNRGHTVFSAYLPTIAEAGSQIEIQAYITDTGGNRGVSDPVSVQLIPDASPPELFLSLPAAGGAGYNLASVELWFNEPLDPTSVNLSQVSLSAVGGGSSIGVSAYTVPNPQLVVLHLDSPLPFADYMLQLPAGFVSDTHGNPLAGPIETAFTSYDLPVTTAVWVSDEDGSFFDPTNWIFGVAPFENQDVHVERLNADPVITVEGGVTVGDPVGNISILEPFIVNHPNSSFTIKGNWHSTEAGEVQVGTLRLEGDAVFAAPLTLNGGTIRHIKAMDFQSDFILQQGRLIVDGPDAQLLITGEVTPGDISIECWRGATLEVPWVTSLGDTYPNLDLVADGDGSVLTFPNLVSLTTPDPEGPFKSTRMTLEAWGGGVLDLPQLQTIQPGRFLIHSNLAGSEIKTPGISALTGPASGSYADVDILNGGKLTAGPITLLQNIELQLDEAAQFPITAITSMTDSELQILGFAPDLSNMETFVNSSLQTLEGGVIELPGFTTLNLSGSQFIADQAGSLIRFPDLEEATGGQTSLETTRFRSQRGGRIEFPKLTTLTGDLQIEAVNTDSVIDLTALTNFTNIEGYQGRITSETGGTIALTNPTLIRADLLLTPEGMVTGQNLTLGTGSTLRGAGTLSANVLNQGLIRINDGSTPLTIDGTLNLDTGSTLEVTIGIGTDPISTGKLAVTGAATIGGSLEIKEYFTYTPQAGNAFEIMSYPSRTGTFSQFAGLSLEGGLMGQVAVADTATTLTVVAP